MPTHVAQTDKTDFGGAGCGQDQKERSYRQKEIEDIRQIVGKIQRPSFTVRASSC